MKIVVATHKPYLMPPDGVYLPLQVGAAGKPGLGFRRDDEGENISAKNANWCELTGLYWAWKGGWGERAEEGGVVGLVHYRRHFRGRDGVLSKGEIEGLLGEADAILPRKRNYFIETTYSQYAHAHHAADLDVTRTILQERCPEYVPFWDASMKLTSGHRFNMFIMRRTLADRYCEWLFDILFELERRLDVADYSPYDARVFGFVAERLLDPWLAKNGIKYVEVPVLYLENQHWGVKIMNFLLRKLKLGGRRFLTFC